MTLGFPFLKYWINGEVQWLLVVSSHGVSSVCAHPWSLFFFLQGHQSYWMRSLPLWPHYILITSLKIAPNTVTLGVRASTYEFGVATVQYIIVTVEKLDYYVSYRVRNTILIGKIGTRFWFMNYQLWKLWMTPPKKSVKWEVNQNKHKLLRKNNVPEGRTKREESKGERDVLGKLR